MELWELNEDGVVRPLLNNYTEIDQNRAILRSRISQMNAKFKLATGKQTIPNLLTALGMRHILPSNVWSQDTLEEILDFGNKFYDESNKDYLAKHVLAEGDEVEGNDGLGGGGFGCKSFVEENFRMTSATCNFGAFQEMAFSSISRQSNRLRGGGAFYF